MYKVTPLHKSKNVTLALALAAKNSHIHREHFSALCHVRHDCVHTERVIQDKHYNASNNINDVCTPLECKADLTRCELLDQTLT